MQLSYHLKPCVIKEARDRVVAIISGEDDRILLVMGPCLRTMKTVLEYAHRLADLQKKKVADKIFIVMRLHS